MSFPQPFNLDGKVAVVTGAGGGLGVAFAEAMAEAGADVVCAGRSAKGLEETVEKVKKKDGKASLLCVMCLGKLM